MKIDLKAYYEEKERLTHRNSEGPFVTISREYGCEANRIVRLLLQRINDGVTSESQKWRFINKEILAESASQLGIKPSDIDEKVLQHSSDIFSDIFRSFRQYYSVSDKSIAEKVKEVIKTYAKKGKVIIIGRGGGIITKGQKNGIRIRLIAPFATRVSWVRRKKSISYLEAEMMVKHFDENRIKWVENLSGTKFDPSLYDLTINVETLSDKEILQLILTLMEQKGMLQTDKSAGRLMHA